MREYVSKLGRFGTVAVITVASVLISTSVTCVIIFVMKRIGVNVHIGSTLFVGISVPIIVAPSVSWAFVGMTLKINHLEEEMRRLATYDSLTGLLNRHGFLKQAEYFAKVAKRARLEFSVLMVDLDHFKEINDQFGHAMGDKVLAMFGKAVQGILRESDLACRLGGDEFIFFLPNTSSNQAHIFAERLHVILRKAKEYDGKVVQYTASMGLTSYPETDLENIEKLMKVADKALYKAKSNGRDQTVIYGIDHTGCEKKRPLTTQLSVVQK